MSTATATEGEVRTAGAQEASPSTGSPHPPRRAARHVPELDGVRGIAVSGVMVMHFIGILTPSGMLEHAIAKGAKYGVWGVDLFFVLSGFLITGILFDAKASERYFRSFYARRTLRIFPLYYAVLLVLFVLLPASLLSAIDPELAAARSAQPWVWTYLTNVYLAIDGRFSIPYVSHFWSLAVEEHFYLAWPLLVRYLSRGSLMRLSVVLGATSLALRVLILHQWNNEIAAFTLTPCRLDTLCAGAWLSLAARGPEGAAVLRRARQLVPATCASIVAMSLLHVASARWDTVVLPVRGTLLAVLFGLVIFCAWAEAGPGWLKRALRAGFLRTLGKYSYGLYVYHGIISYGMHRLGLERALLWRLGSHGMTMLVEVSLGFAASISISVASYELFESRMIQLKKWFEYGQSTSPSAETAS